jgi:hypothetical protein
MIGSGMPMIQSKSPRPIGRLLVGSPRRRENAKRDKMFPRLPRLTRIKARLPCTLYSRLDKHP